MVADLYNAVNVPSVVWIDEEGRIVRPNDAVFVTGTWTRAHGVDHERHLRRIRRWATTGEGAMTAEEAARRQPVPDADHQQARAEFGLAQWLARNGHADRAEAHFARAGELAPHDFTIRRGSLPIRGIDSRGDEFREMVVDWVGKGNPYYELLED